MEDAARVALGQGNSIVHYGLESGARYSRRGFWPRWRLRLTWLSLLALPLISWRCGQIAMAQWSFWPGVLLVVAGSLWRVWASGWLCRYEALVVGGPYALARHPLYLGTGLIALGQSLMSGVPLAPLVFPSLWLALYWLTIGEEEEFLMARYGMEYATYRSRVPSLLPRLRLGRIASYASYNVADASRPNRAAHENAAQDEPASRRFSWHRVWGNRGYEGILINVVAIAVYGWLNAAR